ncbi:MAG: AEC family transporter [Deltaproteobacteria bacterium]|nr:AEC family transporter [Deltaproteobacteria bacterium]
MNIVSTIIPIFSVIILGLLARWKGFIQQEFLEPANRLVYYLAIPALIFRAISKASLKAQFDVMVLAITLFSVVVVFAFAWGMGFLLRLRLGELGTFMQTTFHGNLGYIGLAIAFYLLGNEGFVRASIIAGFLIILQNFLSVISLQFNSDDISVKGNKLYIVLRILGNPVILSALAGILFSISGLKMPLVIDRSLHILGGLALPMALLIIGASLSFELMQLRILRVISSSLLKLILLPGIGFLLYRIFNIAVQDYLPALILLASPTATITYVMAREMGGDADFAVAAISTSTLISSVTFTLWINIAGM